MSSRDAFTAAGHERARELAAARIDEVLPPADAAWLADHLAACPACAAVDAEYAALHVRFAAMRDNLPQPPRDLWARTSAAIDAERGRPAGTGRWRGLRRSPRGSTRLALAPVVAMVAIVVVVGASLLNGRPTVPGGTAVAATPIAIKGAADL
ncbi:MAG TPA: zf-HC2 domain-containing protein, partial [Candidatus Limnocylindrales bacterium]